MEEQRIGTWMQTHSGRKFWPMDPRPEDIIIKDIAHHLSMLCRYNGAITQFYSVGQHSILVSQVVKELGGSFTDQLWGLLHDASEAYIGDMVRPLKRSMPAYKEVEHKIMEAIAIRFSLPLVEPPIVKKADTILLSTERRDLMRHTLDWDAEELVEPWAPLIRPTSPTETEIQFMEKYAELKWLRETDL